MKIIYKYIFRELMLPFLFGVAAFVGIFVGTDVLIDLTDFYVEWGVSFLTLLRLFLLTLPPIIVFSFPMATLLATIMCYNRLSGDNEVTAMRAGGISVHKILIPVLVMGLMVSFLTIGINEILVPRANYLYSQLEWKIKQGTTIPATQTDLFWTPIDPETRRPDYLLYAHHFDGETGIMTDVFLQTYQQGRPNVLVEAARAHWQENSWYFYQGNIYYLKPGSRVPAISFERWQAEQITTEPARIAKYSKNTDDMNMKQFREYIELKAAQGRDVAKELVDWHLRLSIPFASFIFVLLAAPLGLKRKRSGGSALGMGLSIIVIFIYYILLNIGDALGTRGTIAPWLGAWLQNVVFFIIGLVMLLRLG